jgi:uncharacterized membrane protein
VRTVAARAATWQASVRGIARANSSGVPSVRTQARSLKSRIDASRTRLERVADWTSELFGSNGFLIVNVAWFVGWCAWNSGLIPGLVPFDPFPFGLLTMVVSLEAILLSIFVLIAQNRAERGNELRAEVDLQVDLITESELTKVLEIVAKLAAKQGLDLSGDAELAEMLSPTNVDKLEHVLDAEIGKRPILRD